VIIYLELSTTAYKYMFTLTPSKYMTAIKNGTKSKLIGQG